MRIMSLAAFVAVVLLSSSNAVAQGGASARPTSVAVIDINFIFKHHQRFKQAMDDIKKDIEQFEAYLRQEKTNIAKQTEQLKSMPASSEDYRRLESSLANAHTNLQLETGRKRKDILEREAKVYYNAYKEIEERVGHFAHRNGIGLVLRFNSEQMDPTKRESVLQGVNRAVVYQNGLNVTSFILDELNRGTPPPRAAGGNVRPGIPNRR